MYTNIQFYLFHQKLFNLNITILNILSKYKYVFVANNKKNTIQKLKNIFKNTLFYQKLINLFFSFDINKIMSF